MVGFIRCASPRHPCHGLSIIHFLAMGSSRKLASLSSLQEEAFQTEGTCRDPVHHLLFLITLKAHPLSPEAQRNQAGLSPVGRVQTSSLSNSRTYFVIFRK